TSLNSGVPAEASSQGGARDEPRRSASGAPEAEPAPGKGSGSGSAADAGAGAMTWVEREKASRQQAAARAEAERRQADEKRQAADKDRACAQATADLRTLDSGLRLATVNKHGAPEVMDALERARRIESTRRMLAEHCGARS
ncbi:MAG: hypothetical protein ACLGHY_10960, partial [Gammaproteobacteria bacterium]